MFALNETMVRTSFLVITYYIQKVEVGDIMYFYCLECCSMTEDEHFCPECGSMTIQPIEINVHDQYQKYEDSNED
ncbi:hypothetical protein [Salinibacillus kushneri]|uniref:hypothetical protein n=1 Tax=Salinibacillus kushneri TaxID=237682 RepID=UPI000B851CF0|nr:hypothetical protein [Salinibacillus kushneri]